MPIPRKAQATRVQGRDQRPGGVQAAAEQCGDGEGEGHRESDVTHVEHRRVDDQADVLQQRVEVVAVHRGLRQQAAGTGWR